MCCAPLMSLSSARQQARKREREIMQNMGRLVGMAAVAVCACAVTPAALGQAVQEAVKSDISPALSSLQQPPKAPGAFFREHRVKPIPFPPTAAAAQPDNVVQRAAPARLPVG